jgi:diaminopimelate decarboxylase
MSRVVFAGVAKTDDEIRQAIDAQIGLFNIESEQEFENVARLCQQAGRPMRAALRVNPDIDPETHDYTATGKKDTKFGVDIERAERFFQTFGRSEWLRLDAIHLHIGSPIKKTTPYVKAITKTLALIDRLRGQGFTVRTLDIGGGFAAAYGVGKTLNATAYAKKIVPLLRGRGLEVILEPGRSINANAGVLLARVLYVKQGDKRNFVIVDAAMTDLIRPALYSARHFVWPAKLGADQAPPPRLIDHQAADGVKVDIVGGVCESSDFLAKDRVLPPMQRGDLLTVFTAGAYGFVMSSQYNSRPRAAEVLVDGATWRVIRRRETYEDLLAAEELS